MSDRPPESRPGEGAERAVEEVERRAASQDEDHEGRLAALDRLNRELESELEEREPGSRPDS